MTRNQYGDIDMDILPICMETYYLPTISSKERKKNDEKIC